MEAAAAAAAAACEVLCRLLLDTALLIFFYLLLFVVMLLLRCFVIDSDMGSTVRSCMLIDEETAFLCEPFEKIQMAATFT